MHWKAPAAPGIELWRAELLRWAKAEAQTVQSLMDKGIPAKGLNTWNSFVKTIESMTLTHPPEKEMTLDGPIGTSEGVTSVHISKRTDVGEGEKRMNEEQWEREDTNWKEDGTVKEEASANEKTK
ncbi:hypothetical protein NDU88_003386 [Pleurodeles waltl]|uniref:Uncharacterized protein n=1 Tax=Pleurodeles waltl TaxID=8319 RepID=A0AAV7TPL9_PLEWA|nr:hypothetical protein NDU88_003386 [Pleurodeles waltl]